MAHPELLLGNQVCFRVYSLERRITAAYKPLLKRLGLTYTQYVAMLVLWERREADVGELCSELGLDTGTVSPLLKRLEAAGLVERRRSELDERSVRISLTDRGRRLEEKALAVPRQLASCLFGGPDAVAEYRELRDSLDRAIARLGEGRGKEGGPALPKAPRSP